MLLQHISLSLSATKAAKDELYFLTALVGWEGHFRAKSYAVQGLPTPVRSNRETHKTRLALIVATAGVLLWV